MALNFHNLYSDTIYIAFLFHSASCQGTPFKKAGWWQVGTGNIVSIWNVDLRSVNRHAAFWAGHSTDPKDATWSGSGNRWYRITDQSFRQCYDDDTNCNLQRDFVPLDFNGFLDMTVVLGPKSQQRDIRGILPPKRRPG